MTRWFCGMFFTVLAVISQASGAEEQPSWAVRDAVDRLVAQHALFMPGRDGFLRMPNRRLVQYQLPSRKYFREGSVWRVELTSQRWRREEDKGWSAWTDARPKYNTWRIGVIQVDVLTSGVTAKWIDDKSFRLCKPPTETEVTHRLTTQGDGAVIQTVDKPLKPSRTGQRTR